MPDAPRKIPSACALCGQELSRADMESWLVACERDGKDPIAEAFAAEPHGAVCGGCYRRAVAESYEAGDPGVRAWVARVALEQRGMRVLPGGKK